MVEEEGEAEVEGDNGIDGGSPSRNLNLSLNLNSTFNKASAAECGITGNGDSPSRRASTGGTPGASLKLQVELHRAIAQVATLTRLFLSHIGAKYT